MTARFSITRHSSCGCDEPVGREVPGWRHTSVVVARKETALNLTSKRARVPVAVLGSAAVVISGGLIATPATAAGETLGLGPTTNSVTITNADPGAHVNNAGITYGVKVTGAPSADADPLRLQVLTGPTGGMVWNQRVAANGTPIANAAAVQIQSAVPADVTASGTVNTKTLTLSAAANTPSANLNNRIIRIGSGAAAQYAVVTAGGATTTLTLDRVLTATVTAGTNVFDMGPSSAANFLPANVETSVPVVGYTTSSADNVYLGASKAGTYTVRFFKDRNGDENYGAAQDDATPTLTLNVKDVIAETASTSDDLVFTVSAPTSVDVGQAVTASTTTSLTTSDTRGTSGSPAVGVLGQRIAERINIRFNGAGIVNSDASPTFNGTAFLRTSAATSAAGTLTSTPSLAFTGGPYAPSGQAASTNVVDNLVTGLALAAGAGQTDDVKVTATTGATKLRVGVGSVVYTATATVSSGSKSGKTVVFTVTAGSGTTLADLTANGSAVPSDGKVSATTDADGVAKLTVVSTKTANTNAYTVSARSGGQDADAGTNGGTQNIAAVYETPAATTVTAGGNVAAVIGGKVTVTGKVADQFGVGFKPAATPQATLDVDTNSTTFAATTYSRVADIAANGTFSYELDDTGNTSARTDTYRWTVGGADSGTATQVRWLANVTASSVTLNSLGDGVTSYTTFPPASTVTALKVADDDAANESTLVATIKDGTGAVLPFANFTLTGSSGVYFIDKDGKAQTTLSARTDDTGIISPNESTDGVKVVFTKTGDTTITVTAGSASATTGTFKVAQAVSDPYEVTVNDVTTEPGENATISGKVEDAFGNPLPGVTVNLSLPDAEFGAISTSTTPTTNTLGRFTAIFTSGSSDTGLVKYRAAITTNPNPPIAGKILIGGVDTGLTYTAGDESADGSITVKRITLAFTAEASRVGPGPVDVGGSGATPGATLDIYAKRTGTTDEYEIVKSVTADSEGDFGAAITIVRSNSFYAKMGTTESEKVTSTVYSKVVLTATALGGGKVLLKADGNPNQAARMSFYHFTGGELVKIKTVTTSAKGFGSTVWITSKGNNKTVRAYYVATGTRAAFAAAEVDVK